MNSKAVFREILLLPIDVNDYRTADFIDAIRREVDSGKVEQFVQNYLCSFCNLLQVVPGSLQPWDFFFWTFNPISQHDIRQLIARALGEDYTKHEFREEWEGLQHD